MGDHVSIRPATEADLPGIATIYNHEVLTSHATFDLEPSTLEHWQARLDDAQQGDHLLVAVGPGGPGGRVLGYAYSWSYRPRPAYNLTRETSVYLDPTVRGRGIGGALYARLLALMVASGVHTAVALVALPNPGSIALHASCGYERVGTMREVGFKFGSWVDVAWFQKMLP